MKKSLLFVLIALLGFPLAAMAAISGDCSGCHTMHNSQENAPMAKAGLPAIESVAPIANLLRYDCVACHAQNTNQKIIDLEGSDVPQVYHNDPTGDLAGGNFAYINGAKAGHVDSTGNRRGHNVIDLFENGDATGDTYTRPPGFFVEPDHNSAFGTETIPFAKFTCAGAAGCHGTRNQNISGSGSGGVQRIGMAAISGAHHNSEDGLRNPGQNTMGAHDGADVAAGYRFIPGLKGLGNTDAAAPWQNLSASSHNEYYGNATALGTACNTCHINGQNKSTTTQMTVPNQSMSGFCSTCHGNFHSSGLEAGTAFNGTSGAFLRHPSDYVLPGEGTEYAAYTEYNITAPVARPNLESITDTAKVATGDMVMCLSCHKAHASEYDAMLRFDYAKMTAGGDLVGTERDGCLACHTTK